MLVLAIIDLDCYSSPSSVTEGSGTLTLMLAIRAWSGEYVETIYLLNQGIVLVHLHLC